MEFTHEANRIILVSDGAVIAEVTFPEISDGVVEVKHTFVDDVLRGKGIAGKLMEELVNELRSSGRKATLTCAYAEDWFAKHPEHGDLLM